MNLRIKLNPMDFRIIYRLLRAFGVRPTEMTEGFNTTWAKQVQHRNVRWLYIKNSCLSGWDFKEHPESSVHQAIALPLLDLTTTDFAGINPRVITIEGLSRSVNEDTYAAILALLNRGRT